MARFASANDVINRAALEVGLVKANDPVSSTDESYTQLTGLLNAAGQELVELFPWQGLVSNFSLTTQAGDTGVYELPSDFSYMIDQTGWELTNRVPMGGPLSAQEWAYLKGLDFGSATIYASFRMTDNKFDLYPQPPPTGVQINFQYISRNWVTQQGTGLKADSVVAGSDVVMYEPILVIKFLKAKFLESKGFDATAARQEFENMFDSRTGKDTGAPILSASRSRGAYPYIRPYANTPDTGYG